MTVVYQKRGEEDRGAYQMERSDNDGNTQDPVGTGPDLSHPDLLIVNLIFFVHCFVRPLDQPAGFKPLERLKRGELCSDGFPARARKEKSENQDARRTKTVDQPL